MKNRLSGSWLYSLPFFILFLAGIRYVGSHVGGGDSAELALAGATLGIPHSPGYPVFALLQRFLDAFLWFGNSAYQQNLASFLLMLTGLGVVGVVLVRVTRLRVLVFLPLILGFSALFQRQSFVVEVFPLAFAWFAMLLLVVFWGKPTVNRLFLFSLLAGLGLGVHQTLALAYPGLLYFLLSGLALPRKKLFQALLLSLGFFVLGWLVHLYLPIRSHQNPVLDWEDPETWRRFWGVITRERYGFLQLAQGGPGREFDWAALTGFIRVSLQLVNQNLGLFGLILAVLGTILSLVQRRMRRTMVALWLIFLLTGPFFFWLAGAGSLGHTNPIFDRFILLPVTAVFLVIGVGASLIWKSNVLPYRLILAGMLVAMLIQAPSQNVFARDLGPDGARWNLGLREAALFSLRQLPTESILISDRADEMEFALAFLMGADGRRPDVRLVDANAGVSLSAYGDDYYYLWGEKRIERREEVEAALIEKSTAPVFYATIDPLMVTTFKMPWGSLFRAWPLDKIGNPPPYPWDLLFPWRKFTAVSRVRRIYADIPTFLGRAFFDQGNLVAAEDMFGVAQTWGAGDRQVMIGYLYQKEGKIWEARKWYQSAMDRGVIEESLFSNYGNLLGLYGRVDEAEIVLVKGARYFPDSIDILYNLSTIYWKKKEWSRVVFYLEEVLHRNPRHQKALEYLPKALSLERFVAHQPVVKKEEPAPPKPPAPKPAQPKSSTPTPPQAEEAQPGEGADPESEPVNNKLEEVEDADESG